MYTRARDSFHHQFRFFRFFRTYELPSCAPFAFETPCFLNSAMDWEDDADDTSTDDDTTSQTTEEDEIPVPRPHPQASQHINADGPHYQLRHTMRGHKMSISSVKFSPDGALLASSGKLSYVNCILSLLSSLFIAADLEIKIWSPITGKLIRNLTGHKKGNSDVAWSSDSIHLASASDDCTIRIWNVDSVGSASIPVPIRH